MDAALNVTLADCNNWDDVTPCDEAMPVESPTALVAGVVASAFQLETDIYLMQCIADENDDAEIDDDEVDVFQMFLQSDSDYVSQSPPESSSLLYDEDGETNNDDDDFIGDDDDELTADENDSNPEWNDMVDKRKFANILIPLMHSMRRIVRPTTVATSTPLIANKVVARSTPEINVEKKVIKKFVNRINPMSKRRQAELRRRVKRKPPPVFAEITVPQFTDSQFRACFRMSRRACEALTRRLVPQILENMMTRDNPIKPGRPPIPPDKKVLIVLWFFANPQPFRAISDRFEVAKSSVEDCFRRVITALVEIAGEYVRWPTGSYAREVIEQFREISGLPGILGALGTARFTLKTNKGTPKTYADASGHSISVQFVCDHQMLITDCFGGLPGSVSDVVAFRRSDLHARILIEYSTLFPEDSYLIGGDSMPVEPWLITPYAEVTSQEIVIHNDGITSGNQSLAPAKQYFNRCALLALGVMHRTVALLKGRFARLRLLEMNRLEYLPLCVSAACVLHNACLIEDEREVENVQEYVDAGWESMMATMGLGQSAANAADALGELIDDGIDDADRWLLGCQKRNQLCNALLMADHVTDASTSVINEDHNG